MREDKILHYRPYFMYLREHWKVCVTRTDTFNIVILNADEQIGSFLDISVTTLKYIYVKYANTKYIKCIIQIQKYKVKNIK